MYLPEAFQKKMKAILGEEYDDFLAGFEKPRHYGLRVNTAKITVEEFKELVPFHLTQIPWVENGFYYEEEDAPTRHPYYYAGLYYIQEPRCNLTISQSYALEASLSFFKFQFSNLKSTNKNKNIFGRELRWI